MSYYDDLTREQFNPAPSTPRGYIAQSAPPYAAMCECGRRYGMHRVNDFACPNQHWVPGNGQPQWLTRNWRRA